MHDADITQHDSNSVVKQEELRTRCNIATCIPYAIKGKNLIFKNLMLAFKNYLFCINRKLKCSTRF